MQSLPRWLLVVSFLAFGVLASKQVPGSAASLPVIEEVRVGVGGSFKVGHWTPVTVSLRGGAEPARGDLVLQTLDGDGLPYRIRWDADQNREIPAERQTQIVTLAKFGRLQRDLLMVMRLDNGQEISRRLTASDQASPVPSSHRLVATLGDSAVVREAVRRWPDRSTDPIVVAEINGVENLPRWWQGYGGVDALVLTTGSWEPYAALSEEQVSAIEQWVSLGGQLLLCVGANGQELLDTDGKLRRLAPGDFSSVEPRISTRQLQSFGGITGLAGSTPRGEDVTSSMTVLENVRGRIEADQRDRNVSRPALIRAPWGLGQVVFCAVDLDTEPLRSWRGRDRLVGRLLQLVLGERDAGQRDTRRGEMAHVGFEDVSGQLRIALDQFPHVFVVPFSLVAALAALYIAIIGPLDYFVLRWAKRDMGWTWLTFSLTVVLFVFLACMLARFWKGNELSINQVELVDIDVSSGWTRGTAWAHVYSPRSATFDLTLQPDWTSEGNLADHGATLTWNGLSGRGFGGMESRAAPASLADPYTMEGHRSSTGGERVGLKQFPITVWSSRSLWGQWWHRSAADVSSGLSAGSEGLLQGSFNNPLPWALEDCLLAYDGWAYPIGRLETGERRTVKQLSRLRRLEDVLVRRQVDLEEMKNVTTPWNPRSVDVPRIMQMIMFHKAAGGRGYVKLTSRYRRSLDLSDQLTAGRAILVGHAPHSRASIHRDGAAFSGRDVQHGTFYRIVFPVDSG